MKRSSGKSIAKSTESSAGSVDRSRPPEVRANIERVPAWLCLTVLSAMTVGVFINGLKGDFVYDDSKQIVENTFLTDPGMFGRAMVTDVWGYKGNKPPDPVTGATNWSNYWRPTFVALLMLNYQLFGMSSTFGWHLMNVLLHLGVVLVAWGLLRQLRLSRLMATAICAVFAVHPVHVESVTWVSGSPDMLLALPMLASLWCVAVTLQRERVSAGLLAAAVVFYALAALAKESGILYPAIVFVVALFWNDGLPNARRLTRALTYSMPFVLVAAIYLLLHKMVVTEIRPPWAPGLTGMLLTTPIILAFYLRQAFFPLWIGPNYPLRAVVPESMTDSLHILPYFTHRPDVWNLILPSVIVVLFFGGAIWFSRNDRVRRVGLALFLLPLAPAMYINAFKQEEMVHDRYLYLPLLGLLMVVLPLVADWFGRKWNDSRRAQRLVGIGAAVCCVPLGLQTILYNPVWCSEYALWERSVVTDPGSVSSWTAFGWQIKKRANDTKDATARAKLLDDALAAANRALDRHPVTDAYLLRSSIALDQRRLTDAITDLQGVILQQPDNVAAISRLAACYLDTRRLRDAEELLRTARETVPHERCSLTEQLAVVLYVSGQKDVALQELEAVVDAVPGEYGWQARQVYYRLGLLYVELRRYSDAATMFERFLASTEGAQVEAIQQMRRESNQHLSQLRAGIGLPS